MKRPALAALLAALCCAHGAHAQAPLKLLVWINGDKGYTGLQKVGDAFTRVSGVQVVVEHPEDAPPKFQAAVGAGKGPDIFCWAHDRAGEWAKAGLIVPIRPAKAVREDVEPTAWDAFRYQGKLWGYPIGIEAIGLIYNKALVKTPPTSWDEVVALDSTLKAKGKKAVLWEYNKAFFSWPIFAGAGGYVFQRDAKGDFDPAKVGVNTPGAVRAGELLRGLVNGGVMPKSAVYADMEAGFNRGDIAMMISGPWAWDNARKSGISFGVAPIPGVDGKPAKPFIGVLGCMISAPSKVKDIAREFIENHLMRPEGLRVVNADVPLGVPASRAFYAELSADPNIRATALSARHGEPIPNIPETGRFWTAVDAALEAITNGQQSPQDALDGAAARILVK
ncbi:maltose/maltodextrin ABC transporter substrate-binding protein MalE [Ideonella sp. BN130291]|uniref:maltose/maltodextrin ABC transporter substrate-binding protein MalE n=1 Tax=Ideonella sp. BN130291 TaxID=3112940 RepID=UPI002E268AB0|nr:maltose/maltodextrin ABC transporter substrate-binding protein MalE [Ideonella sp. BN130291]